jgi:hypothetical protein
MISSIFKGFSIVNHPAIGVPPFMETYITSHLSSPFQVRSIEKSCWNIGRRCWSGCPFPTPRRADEGGYGAAWRNPTMAWE